MEHFLEKIPLHLPIHGKHSASLQWGLSETCLQSQLGTAAGFQLLFPLFRQKDPGVLWDGVGVSGGCSAVFPPLSVPRWASARGKLGRWCPPAAQRCAAARGLLGSPLGWTAGGCLLYPPPSLAGSEVATTPCPGVGSEGTKGWGGPGGAGQGGHPGVGSARTSSIVPLPCSSGPEQGTACLFPVPAGKGWVPASFPVCVPPRRSPAAWPSPIQAPRAPSCPVGWCWAGWAAQTPLFVSLGGHVGRRRDGRVAGLSRSALCRVRGTLVSPQVTASGAPRDVRGRSLSFGRVLLGQGEVKGSAAPPSGCASPSVGSQR